MPRPDGSNELFDYTFFEIEEQSNSIVITQKPQLKKLGIIPTMIIIVILAVVPFILWLLKIISLLAFLPTIILI